MGRKCKGPEAVPGLVCLKSSRKARMKWGRKAGIRPWRASKSRVRTLVGKAEKLVAPASLRPVNTSSCASFVNAKYFVNVSLVHLRGKTQQGWGHSDLSESRNKRLARGAQFP